MHLASYLSLNVNLDKLSRICRISILKLAEIFSQECRQSVSEVIRV